MSDSHPAGSGLKPRAAWLSPPRDAGAFAEHRFECTSDGDCVSGRLWLPRGAARDRLVLALHPLGSSARDAAVATAGARCAAAGIALAAIDLPLHGDRHNAKLSKRAVAAASGAETAPDALLWRGLLAQAVRDLSRALDALRGSAPSRVATVAFAGTLPIGLAHRAADARIERLVAIARPASAPLAEKSVAWVERLDDLLPALDPW
ncbi:MAG: hypothetical protein FJ091_14345 [Deltaproteobacteria bacterium]|nr:hypothetical protein [Deltaproteobacteria bacterium]